jgi:hypothetical protein
VGRVRVAFEALRVRGYASVRDVGDEWIGVVTQGDDYHEFARQSAMEAAMAIRNFCRQNGLRISEITFTARNGATTENQAGE